MGMPIITGATGIVTKGLKENLETIPGKRQTDSLQKSYSWNITRNRESIKNFSVTHNSLFCGCLSGN
jgi:hypothetical protein